MVPSLSLTGLIVAVYAGTLGSGVAAYSVVPCAATMLYIAGATITVLLTYMEQTAASAWLGKTVGAYRLTCDTLHETCAVGAAYAGHSPSGLAIWQLPSATAQLLSMSASFWTSYIMMADTTPGALFPFVVHYTRAAVLWALVAAVLSYATAHKFVSVGQVAAGLLAGTATGTLFGRFLVCSKRKSDNH